MEKACSSPLPDRGVRRACRRLNGPRSSRSMVCSISHIPGRYPSSCNSCWLMFGLRSYRMPQFLKARGPKASPRGQKLLPGSFTCSKFQRPVRRPALQIQPDQWRRPTGSRIPSGTWSGTRRRSGSPGRARRFPAPAHSTWWWAFRLERGGVHQRWRAGRPNFISKAICWPSPCRKGTPPPATTAQGSLLF